MCPTQASSVTYFGRTQSVASKSTERTIEESVSLSARTSYANLQ